MKWLARMLDSLRPSRSPQERARDRAEARVYRDADELLRDFRKHDGLRLVLVRRK